MLRLIFFAYSLAISTLPASAHDEWSNGRAVPEWVKRQCCGTEDAHHLQSDQVRATSSGWVVEGYYQPIPYDRLLPSPDGTWWVFYRTYTDGSQSSIFCFFGPQQSY